MDSKKRIGNSNKSSSFRFASNESEQFEAAIGLPPACLVSVNIEKVSLIFRVGVNKGLFNGC